MIKPVRLLMINRWSVMKGDKYKKLLMLVSCLTLTSCSLLDTHQINESAKHVKLYSDYEQVTGCRYIGELVGSEGHWYNFFFLTNPELTLSSIIDLKNQANALGADSVHIQDHMGFGTSVTYLGQAYDCSQL